MATEELSASPNTLKHHYCTICGAVMEKQDIDGVLCWACPDPDCGFIEPV